MKFLKPSARENKRYLKVVGKNLKQNIEKAILEFVGVLGLSECGLSFVESTKDYSIICANREAVNKIRASLVVFPEKMEVVKVSGTLRGLERR